MKTTNTTFSITFKSNNSSNQSELFSTDNLQEAENRFDKEDFFGYTIELSDESEIELRKLVDGELVPFEENESRLNPQGGWIIKSNN